MSHIINSRCVLAVQNLKTSTEFYTSVLGFQRDPVDAEGWSFLSRDNFRLMLGECPAEVPAGELGDHSYFVYLTIDRIDDFFQELSGHSVQMSSALADKPWGMREFGIRTPDGHRIMFGQSL
jgi:uncharacterized glyoxalase superfamily protein PhnB